MKIKLGEQLKNYRIKNEKTQEDLALALDVTSQAVSRWEKGICYPDMELIPSIANFFGVSIDELFGYQNERTKKIDLLAEKITRMNRQNNGEDVCMDECINFARECMAEFPGNEKITLCLASALYNAGYVRYGEYHLTNELGYDVYDAERHRTYAEWQEAIKLYEKVIPAIEEGEIRHQAVTELMQLYKNIGETEKAAELASKAPSFSGCREVLMLNACDGEKSAAAYGETILDALYLSSTLMIAGVRVNKSHMDPNTAAQIIKNAADIYNLVCTDGNLGFHHSYVSKIYLYLSEYLWLADRHDEAFEALDMAYEHSTAFDNFCRQKNPAYTAPLLKLIEPDMSDIPENFEATTPMLSEFWPWWCTPDYSKVKAEMEADSRWDEWVKKTKGQI